MKGAAKTRAGLQLARVHLLDGQPEAAIEALALSESPEMSARLSWQRQEVRARALLETGEFGPALAALLGDGSTAAQTLCGEIHWRAGQWASAAKIYSQEIMDVGVHDDGLSAGDVENVLRWAVALAGDEAGLDEVQRRYGAAMAAGPCAGALRISVKRAPESAEIFRTLLAELGAVDEFQAIILAGEEKELSSTAN